MTAAIQYITEVSDSVSRTEYTFSSVSFGSASADRIIALCIETRKTGGDLCEVVECTIGGVPASVVFQKASAPSGTVNYAGIVAAPVPTGTSGTIYIKFSLPVLRVGAQIVSVTGSLVDADASLDDHPSVEFDIPAGGAALGCLSVASSQSFDWVGLTEDYRGLIGGSLRVASASQVYALASNGQALGVTRTSGTWSAPVGVFAVWGPEGDDEPITALAADALQQLKAEQATASTVFLSTPGELAATPRVEAAVVVTAFNAVCHDITIQAEVIPATASAGQQAIAVIAVLPIEIEVATVAVSFAAICHDVVIPSEVEPAEVAVIEAEQAVAHDIALPAIIESAGAITAFTASCFDITLPLSAFSVDSVPPTGPGQYYALRTADQFIYLRT